MKKTVCDVCGNDVLSAYGVSLVPAGTMLTAERSEDGNWVYMPQLRGDFCSPACLKQAVTDWCSGNEKAKLKGG